MIPEAFAAKWARNQLTVCIIGNNRRNPMMKQAFIDWQNKSNGTIKFRFVNNRNADITVRFVQRLNRNEAGINRIGLTTQRMINRRYLTGAEIQIAAQGQNVNSYLSESEIYSTMLHEVGHAIGLGHINNTASIMYPYNNPTGITNPDIKNLKELYK